MIDLYFVFSLYKKKRDCANHTVKHGAQCKAGNPPEQFIIISQKL